MVKNANGATSIALKVTKNASRLRVYSRHLYFDQSDTIKLIRVQFYIAAIYYIKLSVCVQHHRVKQDKYSARKARYIITNCNESICWRQYSTDILFRFYWSLAGITATILLICVATDICFGIFIDKVDTENRKENKILAFCFPLLAKKATNIHHNKFRSLCWWWWLDFGIWDLHCIEQRKLKNLQSHTEISITKTMYKRPSNRIK